MPLGQTLLNLFLVASKIQGMNPMCLSAPWDESLKIISLSPVREILSNEPNGP